MKPLLEPIWEVEVLTGFGWDYFDHWRQSLNESKKTLEIYTHVLSISSKNIQSPFDGIDEILNLITAALRNPVEN